MARSNNPYIKNPNYVSPVDRLVRWWVARRESKKFRRELEIYFAIEQAVDEALHKYEKEWE